jgi:hypothetical protein
LYLLTGCPPTSTPIVPETLCKLTPKSAQPFTIRPHDGSGLLNVRLVSTST